MLTLSASLVFGALLFGETNTVSLAGTWQFRLDAETDGHRLNWQTQRFQEETIFLPGSTDQAGFGLMTAGPSRGWLSRPVVYEGPAWYQREIVIPPAWAGRRIMLFLERPHWKTEVWVDGKSFGSGDSLSTPHVYDLSAALTPGRHRLTICVDNTYIIDVGRNAHSVTDHTHTNWNGIVGRIELQAGAPVWIESARLEADAKARTVQAEFMVRNTSRDTLRGALSAALEGVAGSRVETTLEIPPGEHKASVAVPLAGVVRQWDEYQGELYRLTTRLSAKSAAGDFLDEQTFGFGVRSIGTRGKQFVLNGRPIFLRGTLECNIFPKTGYPPTDVESWARLFKIARLYGLNHFRFHSWCPPEAAFQAADEAGFLLHVELPVWSNSVGKDPALEQYMREEARRILKTYGNHPSFTMFCLGNELRPDFNVMDQMVAELKALDPRRLYTFSADHVRRSAGPTSDYYVTHNFLGPVRIHGARFMKTAGGTDYDFAEKVTATPMPLVAHELGQWVVHPSFEEIGEYTGVLKPRNLEAFRSLIADRGMLDQTKDFQLASGRFSWLVYKEDIETCLRTPNFGGVQLLQLHDFPGQGEALIGLLDSFWNSKSILTPEEMRGFFSETVPLLRLPKFVWTNDETLSAKVQLAHYGIAPLSNAVAEWAVRQEDGRTVASGTLPPAAVPLGHVADLGRLSAPLAAVSTASRLTISVRLKDAANSWSVWCYPKQAPAALPEGILIARSTDQAARRHLARGGKVLLLLPREHKGGNAMAMRFLPVFWSLSWFPKQPGTMGILCDPRHAALASFPTEMHSNWQWWELTQDAPVLMLNDMPHALRPIVQVIDDYHRGHKLGAVIEAKAEGGKLLLCSFDIDSNLDQRVVARQLRHSLLSYMSSDRFDPSVELSREQLNRLLE